VLSRQSQTALEATRLRKVNGPSGSINGSFSSTRQSRRMDASVPSFVADMRCVDRRQWHLRDETDMQYVLARDHRTSTRMAQWLENLTPDELLRFTIPNSCRASFVSPVMSMTMGYAPSYGGSTQLDRLQPCSHKVDVVAFVWQAKNGHLLWQSTHVNSASMAYTGSGAGIDELLHRQTQSTTKERIRVSDVLQVR